MSRPTTHSMVPPSSLHSLNQRFFRVVSISDHPIEGDFDDGWELVDELGDDSEDDWVCLEVLDPQLDGAGDPDGEGDGDASGDCQDVVMTDPVQAEQLSSLFLHGAHFKVKYRILSKADVLERVEGKITRVCTVLLLSRNEALILLQHFKWSVNRTCDEWLACEKKIRKAVGMFERPVVETLNTAEIRCGICHQNFQKELMCSVSCGHQFCHSCWTWYISKAINDVPQCLKLRCPDLSCDAAVGRDMIELLSTEDDRKKFEHHLLRSYLSGSYKAKWCPAPGCDYAVFSSVVGDGCNVTCRCLHSFCWTCSNEAHSPVDCATIANWMSEIATQSENWVLANTTPCPKCTQRLEQTAGFIFIRCSLCNYEFCTTCGGDWSKHNFGDSWGYECHLHSADANRVQELARKSLERHNHYYEGWATNESSRANALTNLKLFQDVQLEILSGLLGFSLKEFNFFTEALLQVVECWRILKWTYVYGYFLPEDEHTKQQLVEFMQEEATDLVRRLQKHVEELADSLYIGFSLAQFMDLRKTLINLTGVTRNYFDGLEEALKTGLSEVGCIPRRKETGAPSSSSSPQGMRGESHAIRKPRSVKFQF